MTTECRHQSFFACSKNPACGLNICSWPLNEDSSAELIDGGPLKAAPMRAAVVCFVKKTGGSGTGKAFRESGFTLIEIIVALSILGLILGVSYSALSNLMAGQSAILEERDNRAMATSLISRMTREIQMSTEGLALLPPRENLRDFFPGRVNLLGERGETEAGLPSDRISFLALEGGQYIPDGGSHSGIVQISYYLARKDHNQDQYNLIREETPYIRPVEGAYERTMTFPIAENVVGLSFSYYDHSTEQWLSFWGNEGRVGNPGMIEFSVILQTPSGATETLKTAVALRKIN